MNEQRRFPWRALILGIGCLGMLCLVVIAAGGLVFFSDLNVVLPAMPALNGTVTSAPPTSLPVPTVTVQPAQPTNLPDPTLIPSPAPAPTDSGPALTGEQRVDEHSLYDDFSSKAFDWPETDDGKVVLTYENQAYSFQIIEPDYYDWAYFPVDFAPYEIWFDVQGPAGQQDGTFGVFCNFQDVDSYYYVEISLEDEIYWIGQYVDGEDIPLTEPNSDGEYWQSTSAFKSPPNSANRIGVSCYLNSIALTINDQWVNEASVLQPFEQPGEAAFFIYTYDSAGENGYKVVFDNVEVWQPVQ